MKKRMMKLAATALLTTGVMASCGNPGDTADKKSAESGNAAYENIISRVSVRDYEACPVGRDTIEMILKGAMQAPSALKIFPRKYVVVEGAMLDSLRVEFPNTSHAEGMKNAPVAIVVCGDMSKYDDKATDEVKEFWVQDCAAAAENVLLSARALGLGSCWAGLYPAAGRSEDMARFLGLPDNLRPLCAVLIGYPGKDVPEAESRWNPDDVIWKK